MQRTLQEHIAYLEQKIEALKRQLGELDRGEAEQSGLRIDLGIAEHALVHFQKAYELELRLKEKISH
jgi:hypothetical protein